MNRKWKTILILSLIGNLFILYVACKALDYRRHVNFFLDKYTYVVSEFSGRSKYALENERLASDVSVGNRIVFLGSQITEGWPLDKQFPGYEAINRGISGQRLVIEFSSYNFRPEYTLEEIEDYLASLAELAKVHGIEPLLTTTIPARERLIYDSYSVADSLVKYNQWLAAFCREHGYLCIDFHGALANNEGFLPRELSISHIELSSAGYERISQATRAALDALE